MQFRSSMLSSKVDVIQQKDPNMDDIHANNLYHPKCGKLTYPDWHVLTLSQATACQYEVTNTGKLA